MIAHYLLLMLHPLFWILLSFLPAINSDLAADRAALLLLSSAVGGRTRHWNRSDPNPCSWEGVNCSSTTTNRVIGLRLPGDGLSGQLPQNSIGNLTQLQTLSLRRNSLSGPLPSDLGSCTELRHLYLQGNNLAGEIPGTLFGLNNLLHINLAGNRFSGQLSPAFNDLTQLRNLSLENNQFSGSIPELNNLLHLREFNVSNNRLNGSIPSNLGRFSPNSFLGNWLCGSPLDSCPDSGGNALSGGAIAGIVIGSVIGLILVLVVSFIIWRKHSNEQILRPVEMSPVPASPVKPQESELRIPTITVIARDNHESDNGFSGGAPVTAPVGNVVKNGRNDGLVFFGDGVEVFSLEELLRASAEVLGKGTFGTTYRAYLEGGQEVVVKRLKHVCVSETEFSEKVEGLGMLAHENLVPPRAYYYGRDEKLLVFESIRMGSLAAVLHGSRGAGRKPLTWEVRRRIALGIASGIEYLHSLGPKVTHGSIKSSNILLRDYGTACVSEFCITQLVSSTSAPNLSAYRAPEVVDTRRVSQRADIYSFGVVLLELLTGKSPSDTLTEEGIDMSRWVQAVVQEKWTIDVFDPELLSYLHNEEQMVQLLHLAIHCTSQYPERRPPMVEVARRIKEICDSRQ